MHWRGSSALGVLRISRPVPFWLGRKVQGDSSKVRGTVLISFIDTTDLAVRQKRSIQSLYIYINILTSILLFFPHGAT